MFFSSPHLGPALAEGWNMVKLLIKANSKDISKQNTSNYEMDNIMLTCRQFGKLELTIIMSVYEGKETKFQESVFNPFRLRNKATKTVRQDFSSRMPWC